VLSIDYCRLVTSFEPLKISETTAELLRRLCIGKRSPPNRSDGIAIPQRGNGPVPVIFAE